MSKKRLTTLILVVAILIVGAATCAFATARVSGSENIIDIESHPHDIIEEHIEVGCNTPGMTIRRCYCGFVEAIITENQLQHTFSLDSDKWKIIKYPYKGKNGEKITSCDVCGHGIITEYECEHEFGDWIITKKPYKDDLGQRYCTCKKCSLSVEENYECIHNFSSWNVLKLSTSSQDGIREHQCTECGIVEEEFYKCKHDNNYKNITKQPNCTDGGEAEIICRPCNRVIETIKLNPEGHTFKNETIISKATPLNYGKSSGTCTKCNKTLTGDTVWNPKWTSSILIPGANVTIEAKLTVEAFTQAAVDANDVVINYTHMGEDEPLVLGHDYGSLGRMYKVKSGDYIFILVNNELEVYRVDISEMAVKNGGDIVSAKTKKSIIKAVGGETLHMYTCYGQNNWIIWATRDREAEKNLAGNWELGD